MSDFKESLIMIDNYLTNDKLDNEQKRKLEFLKTYLTEEDNESKQKDN